AFPRRLVDISKYFGVSECNVSRILNGISKIIIEKIKYGLEFDERQFSKENCERFSKAIFDRGAYYSHIVGFIDVTMRQICRPTGNLVQENMYNGWKHIHCNKFQPTSTPDGITTSL
ncbi:hypothetical protein BD408DRAFT_307764, partial [Parasitella parasitica]